MYHVLTGGTELKIVTEILDEMRRNASLLEIREKYRSQSQIYEAIRLFLDEVGKAIDDKRARILEAGAELVRTKSDVKDLQNTLEKVSEDILKGKAESERLARQNNEQKEKRLCLQKEIDDLNAMGYTPEILRRIKCVEVREGPALWADVKRADRRRRLLKETRALKDLRASLKRDVVCLNEKKDKIKECVKSEQNRLDSVKAESEFFKEALSIVGALFKAGFTTSDLEGLLAGIQLLGIRNDPPLTMARLLQALEGAKTLVCLSDRVETKREELTALNEASSTVKNELRTTETVTLKIIEEARTASSRAIGDVAQKEALAVENRTRTFNELVAISLGKIDTAVQQTIQASKMELGKLEREKTQLEHLLTPASALFWTLESQDYVNTLPLPIVARVADRLSSWCETNVKDFSVKPSPNACAKDFAFLPLQEYKLTACVALLSEGIRQFAVQKGATGGGVGIR